MGMLRVVLPVAACQGHIHHFFILFPGLYCFPCSKSKRMTRFSLSYMLWVLVEEKCTSTKYFVLSIFCCKQGVNRPVVPIRNGNRLHLYFLRKRPENRGDLQRITVPCLTGWSGSHTAGFRRRNGNGLDRRNGHRTRIVFSGKVCYTLNRQIGI